MRIVIALGGNALLRRGEPPDLRTERDNILVAVAALAPIAREHMAIITHGNGPQVGLLAARPGAGPLDVLDAQTEGEIGYLIAQALGNRLPGARCAALLTQVEIDPHDPAFAAPTKPIGPPYEAARAHELARANGWTVAPDGDRWRRVVASPRPQRIVELPVIELLVAQGVTVICAGGGGIPVVRRTDGAFVGVEAVIDKDRASALLAVQLNADALLLLTDVDAVYADWPVPAQRPLRSASAAALRERAFAPGSMAPKVEAACAFAETTGRFAAIGRLEDAAAILAGHAGTRVTR
ncbi:MAG: carbamate kinase [Gammaproteobacteria bacterium]